MQIAPVAFLPTPPHGERPHDQDWFELQARVITRVGPRMYGYGVLLGETTGSVVAVVNPDAVRGQQVDVQA